MRDPDMTTTTSIQIGDYVLGEPLGRGGMGRVWQAHHIARGTAAALKIATSPRASRQAFLEDFEREVQAAASLNHPGVVTVFDYGRVGEDAHRAFGRSVDVGAPWLAMSLAEMGTMEDHRPGSFRELRHVLLQLLDALAHSHARGVIHRDLKPSNLLVSAEDAHGPRVVLSDFGIAHVERAVDTPTPDQMKSSSAGTPLFMSPEQFRGDWRKFGPPTDLYAVGCLSYFWATGEAPFDGRNVITLAMQHNHDPAPALEQTNYPVPDGFDAWVATLLEKSPAFRFELAADAAWNLLALGVPDEGRTEGPERHQNDDGLSLATLGKMTTQVSELSFVPTAPSQDAAVDVAASAESTTRHRPHIPPPPMPSTWRKAPMASADGPEDATVGAGLFGLREVPFVDRNPERDIVWSRLSEVHRGEGSRAVILRGPAGCGKSKLAGWMSARALEMGAATTLTVLNSEGYGSDEIAWALGRHLRVMGMSVEEARESLNSTLSTLPEELLPLLVRLLAPVLEIPANERMEGVAKSMRTRCIHAVLAALAQRRPLVLWLDDAQWATEGLEFVHQLLDMDESPRVLAVLTVRDEALSETGHARHQLDRLSEMAGVSTVDVGSLSREDEAELVRGMLDLAPEMVEEVVARTGGNPLFAVQLVGEWVQRDCLEATPNGLTVTDRRELDGAVDIEAVWKRRLDSLYDSMDDDAPVALQAAAVLGVTVRQHEWEATLSKLGVEAPTRLVGRLALQRLAKRHESGWAFAHGLLVDALIDEARQSGTFERINAACAEALDDVYPSPNTFQATRTAQHYRNAKMLDEASEAFIIAGREARATEHFPQMFASIDAIEACIDALQLPESDERHGWLEFLDIAAHFNQRPLDVTLERANALIDDASRLGWRRVGAEARMAAATALSGLGKYEDACRLCREAATRYEALDARVDYARALGKLGFITSYVHRPEEARRLCEQSLAIQLEENDRTGQARNYDRLAFMLRDESPAESRQYYEKALPLAREQGMLEEQAHILDGIAHLDRDGGDYDDARRGYTEAAETFAAIGSAAEFMARMNLALLDMTEGAFDRARPVLDEAIDVFETYGVHVYALRARAARLHCRLELDEDGAARDLDVIEDAYADTPTHGPQILAQVEVAATKCSDEALRERLEAFADLQRDGLT